ncbi:cytochrome c5 family protein [Pseudomonas putida]|uniref:cytochrome c5 family protein n=1 Tax=Pseudomonas putida TaxID=303 RepID=UPI001E4A51C9|nr:cytochrome c5 family protein [Pseudomonas putida]
MFLPVFSAQATQDSEVLYNRVCAGGTANACSMSPDGQSGNPNPDLAQCMNSSARHNAQGFKAMPPRGLCMDCSAEDYRLVILWMNGSPDT